MHLGYEAFNEPVKENPYLEDFYADMNRWGAMMQIHLLFRRFEQHQQIVWNSKKGTVQDRTIYEDARMLHEAGFILPCRIFQHAASLNLRGFIDQRDAERHLDLGHESFIAEMDHYTRVLTLDWNEYIQIKKKDENRSYSIYAGLQPINPSRNQPPKNCRTCLGTNSGEQARWPESIDKECDLGVVFIPTGLPSKSVDHEGYEEFIELVIIGQPPLARPNASMPREVNRTNGTLN